MSRHFTISMIAPLAAALLLAGTAPAHADPRLTSHAYNANEVVRIDGRPNVQGSIIFDEDEHIENVAVGDSNTWQVTPNKRANLLFVKPLAVHARTNMTVLTDQRSYFFDLVSSPAATPVYVLRFTYPNTKRPVSKAGATAQGLNPDEAGLAAGARPVDPAQMNTSWRKKGDTKLYPARIYDDGNATYLSWTAGKSVPAILVRDAKGNEGAVNYAVRGDTIVVDGVPQSIILRSGHDSATLEYAGTRQPKVAVGGQ
jgi:type IV secretion system protein VirB9